MVADLKRRKDAIAIAHSTWFRRTVPSTVFSMQKRFQIVIREIVEQLDFNKIRYDLVGRILPNLSRAMLGPITD